MIREYISCPDFKKNFKKIIECYLKYKFGFSVKPEDILNNVEFLPIDELKNSNNNNNNICDELNNYKIFWGFDIDNKENFENYLVVKFYENCGKILIIDLAKDIDIVIEKILKFLKRKEENCQLTNYKKEDSFFENAKKNFKNNSSHSEINHNYKKSIEDMIFKLALQEWNDNDKVIIEKEKNVIFFDIGFSISKNPYRYKGRKILFIDDNKDTIEAIIQYIFEVFPNLNWEFYLYTDYKNFLDLNKFIDSFLKKDQEGKFKVMKYNKDKKKFELEEKTGGLENFSSIFVDIYYNGKDDGFKIIRTLEHLRRFYNSAFEPKLFYDIFAVSRSNDVEDIQRALKEGALYFIPKFNILRLPGIVAMFENYREDFKDLSLLGRGKKFDKYRNFGKLYNLPNSILRQLQTEPFLDLASEVSKLKKEIDTENKKNISREIGNAISYLWIKRLPKADLHYHLGGSMTADIVFNLSLNSIRHMMSNLDDNKINSLIEDTVNNIATIINPSNKNENNSNVTVLLESIVKFFEEKKAEDVDAFFDNLYNNLLQENKIEKFQTVNLFNVIIGVLDGYNDKDVTEFWKEIENCLNTNNNDDEILNLLRKEIKYNLGKFNELGGRKKQKISEQNIKLLNMIEEKIKDTFSKQNSSNSKQTLNKLIQYVNNCDKNNNDCDKNRLPYYLKGSGFTGSELLQFYDNIIAAVSHLLKKASYDNVRYLEIRCSPDGYTKKHLSTQDAIDALFNGADLFSRFLYVKEKKFIWANFIFTAKRHKDPEEIAKEIGIVIANLDRKTLCNDKKVVPFNYKWQKARLVGIDLAGLENKNTRPGKFKDDFYLLAKAMVPVTIHAGEQDTHQAIWEAIYMLYARRIGHGLSLKENSSLLRMIKNAGLCVELNPYSNIFTNPKLKESYPIFEFFNAGINIAIGTDDKAFSGTELSNEYVKAAELYFNHNDNQNENKEEKKLYLTKWDILKLIKNSFRFSFIQKNEKRDLLIAVESEIFTKIHNLK